MSLSDDSSSSQIPPEVVRGHELIQKLSDHMDRDLFEYIELDPREVGDLLNYVSAMSHVVDMLQARASRFAHRLAAYSETMNSELATTLGPVYSERDALAAQVERVKAVLAEHWDWKAGRTLHAAVSAALEAETPPDFDLL